MKKISNTIMLILLIAAIFIFYTEMLPIKIEAVNLAAEYSKNKTEADNDFLLKEIEVTGVVKAYYKLLDVRNVLEFNNEGNDVAIFCFFLRDSDEFDASKLRQGDTVTVTGTCAGMNKYDFVDGLKIEVKKFIK
jgi:hypothetical protein